MHVVTRETDRVDAPFPTPESLSAPAERVSVVPVHPPTPIAWRLGLFGLVALIAAGVCVVPDSLGRHARAALGIVCFLTLIAGCSTNLRAVRWKTIAWGVVLQLALALVILKTTAGETGFRAAGEVMQRFMSFSAHGAMFIFGKLADPAAVEGVFGRGGGFIFAFQALPIIIFVSSFFTVLYYLGLLQFVVRMMARAMMFLMGTSGAETLSAAANVFMGQTEAPLIVKPYIARMTRSELLTMMTGGMATIAGTVMATYVQMGADAAAVLATSVMAAPCGLYIAKLMMPETATPETEGRAKIPLEKLHANVVDAAAAGASDGMHLALNVAAVIIAFLGFLALADALLALVDADLSLARIFSKVFYPVALLMGCEVSEAGMIADLLGTKLVANEFIAYQKIAPDGAYHGLISREGVMLATFALTGFANLGSIGIQIGGIGALAPTRRGDLAALGGRALLCGFVATLLNASLAGLLMN